MTEMQPVAYARCNSNNIFDHPTHLHANDIRRGINSKILRAHRCLDFSCYLFTTASDSDGCWQASSNFTGKCRTGEEGMPVFVRLTEDLGQDVPHCLETFLFEPLGATHHGCLRRDIKRSASHNPTRYMRRNNTNNQRFIGDGSFDGASEFDARRQDDAGKIGATLSILLKLTKTFRPVAPE